MLLWLQNLDNAGSAVVADTSGYIAVPGPAALTVSAEQASVAVAAQADVAIQTEGNL